MVFFEKLVLFISLFIPCVLIAQPMQCGFAEMLQKSIANDWEVIRRIHDFNQKLDRVHLDDFVYPRSEIKVPVVVHIVWYYNNENVSDNLVYSQIEALNRDFNAENVDIGKIPIEFLPSIGVPNIRFCLAAKDPYGNYTTGILKRKTPIENIGMSEKLFSSIAGGSDAWDPDHYLNIWVANTGQYITGFGTYPLQSLKDRTGVVIHPDYFGINGNKKYGLGRVTTHEIGHFFGLYHPWADDDNCNTDDLVADTPPQQKAYYGCPDYPLNGCVNSEMFMNFMGYVDDHCMQMFTEGQKQRMLKVIELARPGFLNSNTECKYPNNSMGQIFVWPNPTDGLVRINFTGRTNKKNELKIFNTLGQLITLRKKITGPEFLIDLSAFPKGLYFFKH